MRRLLAQLEKFGTAAETVLLVGILTAMMVIAVGQIVMREAFGSGFGWADELVRLMVLWLALIGSIAACRENRHIRIDALSHILPDAFVRAVRIVVDLFAAVVAGVIAFHAWRYLQVEIEYGDTVLVDTPAWAAHIIMPTAFALISYRFLVASLKDLGDWFFGVSAVAAE